jgi:hypothetical protein
LVGVFAGSPATLALVDRKTDIGVIAHPPGLRA